jgi:hypothetical protein
LHAEFFGTLGEVMHDALAIAFFVVVLPFGNRSHPLKKSRQRDDLYGIVAKLGNDLTDAARCT